MMLLPYARRPRLALPKAGSTSWVVVGELVVVLGLFFAYRSARLLVGASPDTAFANARRLLDAEKWLRLPNELHVQDVLLSNDALITTVNVFYATVHFPLTAIFLVWLFVRSREVYLQIRTILGLMTGAALILHAAFPLAPPRMFPDLGFVDTAQVYGPSVYDAAPETDSVANQFAAMPSLHFGWAVLVAIGIIRASRSPRRWLWILHPFATLFVIVGSGNHYWLDAIVAAMLLIAADLAVQHWAPMRRLVQPVSLPAVAHGVRALAIRARAEAREYAAGRARLHARSRCPACNLRADYIYRGATGRRPVDDGEADRERVDTR